MIILPYEERLKVLNKLNENYDEKKSFEERNFDYDFRWIEDLKEGLEEKYPWGATIYRLFIGGEETNMTIMETWERNGSYDTGFNYKYEKLDLCEQFKKVVTDWKIINE